MPRLGLQDLLNPTSDDLVFKPPLSSSVAPSLNDRQTSPQIDDATALSSSSLAYYTEQNIRINRRTCLSRLYHYALGTLVEYPETTESDGMYIGHIFTVDPANGSSPTQDFTYSLGTPAGKVYNVRCAALLDTKGHEIPCDRTYLTCQGVKVCPYIDLDRVSRPHTSASRKQLLLQIEEEHLQIQEPTPSQQIFLKTLALWTAIRDNRCSFERQEATLFTMAERVEYDQTQASPHKARRGQQTKTTCEGRISLLASSDPRWPSSMQTRCEHFRNHSRKHLNMDVETHSSYDLGYLHSLFFKDEKAIYEKEIDASKDGYGPLVPCHTVRNRSSVKFDCDEAHRNTLDASMLHMPMVHLKCNSKFWVYHPQKEHRRECPHILVVCHTAHTHSIPILFTTLEHIQSSLQRIAQSLDHDLPDITPRHFMRHSILRAFLRNEFPHLQEPMLTDMHPSLANLDHLGSIISAIAKKEFPSGTGWSELYVQYMVEMPWGELAAGVPVDSLVDEGEPVPLNSEDSLFRVVICMFPQRSHDLLKAKYVMSDISFKHVSGYKEFELVGYDRTGSISIVFCRALLNSQSAAAHKHLFDKIWHLVLQDTGELLQYRHLHSPSLSDHHGILHWAADQDGGQAKGLGLHLQQIARTEINHNRMDLSELNRRLWDLSPYEHLHRIYRLCTAHLCRNIQSSSAPDFTKQQMRTLICITHPAWDLTVDEIWASGKAGNNDTLPCHANTNTPIDWVENKVQSKFAFEAMAWHKSRIPCDIWESGDATTNISEALHADINREGIQNSLLGGIMRARYFDTMRMKVQTVSYY
ncbi:hypothetical protein EV421DRAFT_1704284 [Armillaria borealis]|uniref:Uncharacterized protein n=1 Tax=Armillaria borealis TaxID=47425 RepID=A0AA39JYN8_9AGAR|nr:hypothetical protein EV421DRAFT_1704284 [Armillaria borealis]